MSTICLLLSEVGVMDRMANRWEGFRASTGAKFCSFQHLRKPDYLL